MGAAGYIPPSRGQQCLRVNPKLTPLFRDKVKQVGVISGAFSAAPESGECFLYEICGLIFTEEHRNPRSTKPFRKQRSDPFTS